jgi:uncharacterized protein (TIGR02646 family)
MINLERNLPAPPCLAREKEKADGDCKCGEVLAYLVEIFHNKCYICELKEPISINVEHFKPHRGDKNLKFEWNNLFLSCSHCNNTKLAKIEYDDILDCTNPNHRVEEWIRYEMKPFPKSKVKIIVNYDIEIVKNTVKLLDSVYNGEHTQIKNFEADNLRKTLLRELRIFQECLFEYYDDAAEPDEKEVYLRKIRRHLKRSSAFCAFKRWIIKENDAYMKDFSAFLD